MRAGSVVAALVLCGAVACGGDGDGEQAGSSERSVTDLGGCLGAGDAELSRYADDSVEAAVGIMGEGVAGVVISYEQDGSVCPWLGLAETFVGAGYGVLLYERLDGPEGAYVAPMVDLLREHGATQVGLVGGSIGGMVSITEAPDLDPRPAVVVSLSGARSDTVSAASDLTMPLLMVVATDDTTFAGPARATVRSAAASPDHQLVELPGNAHASLMLTVEPTLDDTILAFIEQAMPPG